MADARAAAATHRHLDGIRAESRIQAELAAAMKGFDALLCPASAIPALEADASHLTALSWMAHRWSTTGRPT
ncbi:hypothetical protein [Arthrobacter sp. A5]|uniref:hypothetical protein n=1 Tax=Arthrobacter sp. A5 TaxID=576926 RepID=UPI003DA8A132